MLFQGFCFLLSWSYLLFVSQHSALNRTSLARGAVAGAMLVLPVACGTGDEAVFDTTSAVTETTTAAPAEATTAPTAVAPETTVVESATNAVFPTGAELVVSFTYEPSSSAQAKRPYVAVWVEDADGNLVDTISLWFEQSGKGQKWLSDLRRWYSAGGATDTTMSGATRVAGDYTVAWDGTDADGDPVVPGHYVLYIEAAREHGPYSLTSGSITISDAGMSVALADEGELSAASAELMV